MTVCEECGPVVHQPIPEDESHCDQGPECACHLPSCLCGKAVIPGARFCSWACFDRLPAGSF